MKISGTTRWYEGSYVVSSLSFTFQQGLPLAWGNFGGDKFEYTFAVDETLVGFSGRAADYLDQILPVVVKFAPVTWHQE